MDTLASENVQHLSQARVVLAEYDALQHDFPELSADELLSHNPELSHLAIDRREEVVRSIIDEWLIANAAFVSTAQAAQAIVNTPIHTDGRRALAYRPPDYGRAIVVPTQDPDLTGADMKWRWRTSPGLLDLKGAGVQPDRPLVSVTVRNGLEYLGLALSDFLLKKAIDEVLARSLPTVWTVPVYAVLDLGFDILGGYHGNGPAGMHVRRAHRRRLAPQAGSLEDAATFDIESVLRRYGITCAPRGCQFHITRRGANIFWQRGSDQPTRVTDPERIGFSLAILRGTDSLTLDRRDVQLAREVSWPPAEAQLVDFGALRVESRFECPMIRSYTRSTLAELVRPEDMEFVQPDPDLQLPYETWRRHEMKSLCFTLADAFRRRTASSNDVRHRLDKQLHELTRSWLSTVGQAPPV